MNNQSSWRGQGPHRLQWRPSDFARTTDFLDALTFENTLPLFEMRGRDVIELLNMPAGPNPPGGAAGAQRDPATGLPNWGTMQGQTVAGAFLLDGVWHLSSTLEPISETGIYLFGASNHMFGGHVGTTGVGDVAGGQNMPLPGNTFGNALGFEVINFVGGQLELNGNRYYSGPRFAMRNPETGMHLAIQAAWREQSEFRATQTENIAAWVEVLSEAGGTAVMDVWGFEARPDAPGNHSYWGPPAMLANTTAAHGSWVGEQTSIDLVLRGAVVRATATPATGSTFLGWYDSNGIQLSTNPVFVFNAESDITIYARWSTGEEAETILPIAGVLPVTTQYSFETIYYNNRTLVPLRAVAEAMGNVVTWDEATRRVEITSDDINIAFYVDYELLPQGLGTAVIIENRTFVPVEFISTMIGDITLDGNVVYVE